MVLHVSPCVDGVLTHELSSSLTQPPLIPQCSKLADRPEAQHASAFGPAAAVRAGEQPNRAGGVVRRFPQLVHVIGERGSMALAPQLMRHVCFYDAFVVYLFFMGVYSKLPTLGIVPCTLNPGTKKFGTPGARKPWVLKIGQFEGENLSGSDTEQPQEASLVHSLP